MRLQTTTGDRRRAEFVALVIARLAAIALLTLALMLASCCTPPRYKGFIYPYAPASIDVSKCQARRASYAVRQAYTFRGVSYPADSMLLRDSVVDLDACRRGGR